MALSRRLVGFYDFALEHLPPPPARVLEVGCGRGELALALAEAGYDVTAIDPEAPEGPIFRRVRLEEFSDVDGFDAVVASVSLHHVHDLGVAFDKLERLLRPAGRLVLEEFAKERLHGATAGWYFEQRQARAQDETHDDPLPDDVEKWLRAWHVEHADIHPSSALLREVDARFTRRFLAWTPYLYDYRLADDLEPVERGLIEAGAIEAVGFRYAGERR